MNGGVYHPNLAIWETHGKGGRAAAVKVDPLCGPQRPEQKGRFRLGAADAAEPPSVYCQKVQESAAGGNACGTAWVPGL